MTTTETSALHGAVASYYAGRLAEHGPTPRGVDWKDGRSQAVRHRQFLRLLGDDHDASIADLGCGYGDFLDFLRQEGHRGEYVGYDIAPEMIAAAHTRHGAGADRQWRVGSAPEAPADYVVASGIFNVKQACSTERWGAYVDETVAAMAAAARRGFGFNVLSLHSDPERRRDDLYFADPAMLFDRCARRYGRRIALLQDYDLYEFTLLIRTA